MDEIVYRSHIRVERMNHSSLRRAYLPAESEPVLFGTHGEIAKFYGRNPDEIEPHATTLDYLVASAVG